MHEPLTSNCLLLFSVLITHSHTPELDIRICYGPPTNTAISRITQSIGGSRFVQNPTADVAMVFDTIVEFQFPAGYRQLHQLGGDGHLNKITGGYFHISPNVLYLLVVLHTDSSDSLYKDNQPSTLTSYRTCPPNNPNRDCTHICHDSRYRS